MTLITGQVNDATTRPDDTEWVFWSETLRSDGDDNIVTTKRRPVSPVGGAITVDLEPGSVAVQTPDGNVLYCLVPDQDTPYSLWDLIEDGVAYPVDTSYELLVQAIESYLPDRIDEIVGDVSGAAAAAATAAAEAYMAENPDEFKGEPGDQGAPGVTGNAAPASHGSDANYQRPDVEGSVIWVGSVEPNNAIDGDVWLDVSGSAPSITTTVLGALYQGLVTNQTLVRTGTTPVIFTVTSGSLPAGLSLSTAGELSGTPSGTGAYSFTVTATNGYGTDTQAYSGTVGSPLAPTITTTSLGGTVQAGVEYLQTVVATGSTPITWAVTSGSIPSGLTLNTSTGVISGTPSTSGAYSFTLRATNTAGYDDQAFSGTVLGTAPVISTTVLNAMSQGAAFSQIPTHSGTTPIAWAVTSGSLPGGLSINSSTGEISGTPSSSGAYSFTLTAENGYGDDSQAYSGTVASAAPIVTTTSLNTIYTTIAFSQTLAATGGTPITWAVQSGSLPTGLSLNTSTGAITGTASSAGAYSFTIRATNAHGYDDQAFTGSILSATPAITETSLNEMRATQAFTQTLHATGAPTIAWSVIGTLPTGLSLNSSTGVLSGTPTTAGAYSFTVRASNSAGYDDQAFSGTILSLGVEFNVVGAYGNNASLPTSGGYTINGPDCAAGDLIVVWIQWGNGTGSPTIAATYDGAPMTLKGNLMFINQLVKFGLACLVIEAPTAGIKTISITASIASNSRVQSLAYSGVGSVGSFVTANAGSGTPSHSVSGADVGDMISHAFGYWPSANNNYLTAYNRTERKNGNGAWPGSYAISYIVGDAEGTGSALSFTGTASGYWGSAAIVLEA